MPTTFYPSYSPYTQSRFMKQGNPPSFPNNTFGVGAMVQKKDSVSFNKPKLHFGGEFEDEVIKTVTSGRVSELQSLLSRRGHQPAVLKNIVGPNGGTLFHSIAEITLKYEDDEIKAKERFRNHYTDMIQYLYNRGVPIDAKNRSKETALKLAISLGNMEPAKLLIQPLTKVDLNGSIILHLIVNGQNRMSEAKELAQLLIEKGANVLIEDEDGKIPLDILKSVSRTYLPGLKDNLENFEKREKEYKNHEEYKQQYKYYEEYCQKENTAYKDLVKLLEEAAKNPNARRERSENQGNETPSTDTLKGLYKTTKQEFKRVKDLVKQKGIELTSGSDGESSPSSGTVDKVLSYLARTRPYSKSSGAGGSRSLDEVIRKVDKEFGGVHGFVNEMFTRQQFQQRVDWANLREEEKTNRRKMWMTIAMLGGAVVTGVAGITLMVVAPPIAGVLAVGAVLNAVSASSAFKVLGGLVVDLAKNPEAMPRFKNKVRAWTRDLKKKFPKLPGSDDTTKRTNQLINRMHEAAKTFQSDVDVADTPEQCFAAVQKFRATLEKNSMDHIMQYGTNEQKQELQRLRTFMEKYENITAKLGTSGKGAEDLERYDRELQEILTPLQTITPLRELVETLQSQQNIDLTEQKNLPGKAESIYEVDYSGDKVVEEEKKKKSKFKKFFNN